MLDQERAHVARGREKKSPWAGSARTRRAQSAADPESVRPAAAAESARPVMPAFPWNIERAASCAAPFEMPEKGRQFQVMAVSSVASPMRPVQ